LLLERTDFTFTCSELGFIFDVTSRGLRTQRFT